MHEERNRKAASVLALLLMLGGLLVFSTTVRAAGVTLYFVGDASGGCASMLWSDSACWSTSDFIPGNHAPPTSADDAHFDTGSIGNTFFPHALIEIDGTATANDIILAENNAGGYIQLTVTGTIAFHSLTATGGAAAYYFGGDDGTTVSFSGTVDGIAGNLGGANNFATWTYTGSPPAEGGAQMSNDGVYGMHATTTIYCNPGCTDYGSNENVVFGPAPAPAPITPPVGGPAPTSSSPTLSQVIAVDAFLIAIAVVIVLLLALIIAALRPLLPWLVVILLFAVVVWLIFSGVV